ncbi:MAG: FtsX-like permease family protein [Bacteroidia bacterium]|nr:FtsX-like permease family protein [Bacteroidia bacterium]
MLKNTIKIAVRNFLRHKGYSVLNILGLAIGIASSLLILQYVIHELSYDKFHTRLDRIYRVEYDFYKDGEPLFKCATAFPGVGPAAKADFPEVETFTRFLLRYGGGIIRYKDVSIKEDNVFMGEPSLFDVFSYELLEGDPKTVLEKPNTGLIAEDVVEKYFGDEDPIGKRIKFGTNEEYEITGILRSPENSHLKFSFIFSLASAENWGPDMVETLATNWGWYDFFNYLLLKPGTDPEELEAKFPAFVEKHTREGQWERTKLVLQPVQDIHLYSDLIQEARVNGNGTIAYVLLTIALFILVIAWINYINLATARAMERAREVGVRKVVGASRYQLIAQFITESLMLNIVAAIFAIIIFELFQGYFNQLAGKNLDFNLLTAGKFWIALLGLFLTGAFLSGIYPAFVLSSYKPISVLKGRLASSRHGVLLRKTLVVGQFFTSSLLIAGTIIVYQQISFMQGQELGINIEQTLVIDAPGVVASDSVYVQGLNVFKQELLSRPGITDITSSTEVPGTLIYWTNGARRLGQAPETSGILYKVGIDYDYITSFGHKLLAGRAFSETHGTEENTLIINESAMKMLGFGDPESSIGQKVIEGGDTVQVIGVISDYHQEGLKKGHDPIGFRLVPHAQRYYSLKVNTADLKETLAFIEEKYLAVFPENPFNYFFLDEFFNRQYASEIRFAKVFGLFASLAIFVACLGLLGLSAFSANQRAKEISIRKVLGSTIANIFMLLSKDYFLLIILGNLLAVPLVLWGMNQWLKTFAFGITISGWVFLLSTITTLLISLLAVSYQSLKAARSNPVNALRNE